MCGVRRKRADALFCTSSGSIAACYVIVSARREKSARSHSMAEAVEIALKELEQVIITHPLGDVAQAY